MSSERPGEFSHPPDLTEAERWALGFGATAVLYLGMSTLIVAQSASDEPYSIFSAADALIQVGLASSLLTLAVLWVVLLVRAVRRRVIGRGWLAALIPIVIWSMYLANCPFGYVHDMEGAAHAPGVTRPAP